jgi:GntR family transcriptional repressor for pyruvate dehydrogenase complex
MTTSRPFEPVERANVSEQVRDDIHRRIVSGEIQPGSRVPAERVLAEQFGVARSSIREAIQGLIALGVIERRGNRSYVPERVPGSDLPPADGKKKALREILEARQVLESMLFELAAARASARERNKALALARMPAPATLEEFMIADRQFHAAIAQACGNAVLIEVYGRVLDVLVTTDAAASLVLGLEAGEDPAAAMARAGAEHLRIATAFAARDVDVMLEEVDLHLGPVAWRMSRLSQSGRPPPSMAGTPTGRTVGM